MTSLYKIVLKIGILTVKIPSSLYIHYAIFNPFKPSILFCRTYANSVDPDQMKQNEMKNTTQQLLKLKWTGPLDNSGKSIQHEWVKKNMTQFSVLQTLLKAGSTYIVSIPINEPAAGF